jgi:hypothetical protein
VPVPSAAFTVIDGDDVRFVSTPPVTDFSCAGHVCAPALAVATAPSEAVHAPPDVAP